MSRYRANDNKELLETFVRRFASAAMVLGDYVIKENAEWVLAMRGLTKVPGTRERRYNDAFLSTAEVTDVMGVDPRRAGDLLSKLGVNKSKREGYRISELGDTARRLRRSLLKSDEPGR